MARVYPALDVTWSVRPDDDHLERLLAEIDEAAPTAIEERPAGGVRVFFASAADRGRAAVRLIAADPTVDCTPVDVPDDDWAVRSQASLGPVRVGQLIVAPPWATEREVGTRAVIIQPSMGFGSGHHASTRVCLRLLQQVPIAGARVLDAGTGSGVLALAAWRLGAAPVVAIDSDTDALESARDNIGRNGAGANVFPRQVDLASGVPVFAEAPFDLLLANLTGGLLMRQAARLAGLVSPTGRLIVSGWLLDEEPRVLRAFAAAGWSARLREEEDEWAGLVLVSTIPIVSTGR